MKITRTVALVSAIMQVQFTMATDAVSPAPEMTCNSCCLGPAGTPGIPGSNGRHGLHGPSGPRGDAGSHGEVGEPGAKGDTGSEGLNGEPGANGVNGEHGLKGEQGVGQPGKQGPQGMRGTKGLKGERGKPGSAGQTGEPGTKGDKELDGLVGEQGAKGDHGLKGEQGVGQKGKQGPKGLPGVDGFKGEIGAPGPVGKTGEAGECSTRRSAFTAVRNTHFSPPSAWDPLPFEEYLFSGEGTDFNFNNSTFTCTVPGIYVFIFSVHKTLYTSRVDVCMNKNGKTIVSGSVHSPNANQVSSSAVIPMHFGDQVHLAVDGYAFSNSGHYTSFTGFMLYEI